MDSLAQLGDKPRMAGGYRVILAGALAALVFVTFGLGWMSGTLGTHPQNGGREPQDASGHEIAGTIENLKAPLNADEESPNYKQPCDDSRPNRNSDLCAQWEAVDAAQSVINPGRAKAA